MAPGETEAKLSETAKWFDAIVNGEFRDRLKEAIVHPSDYEFRALRGIFYYLYMYKKHMDEAEKLYPGDNVKQHWHLHEQRQAMRDAVDWQKLSGFLEDYNLSKQTVKFRGVWYSFEDIPEQYRGPKFIQLGPVQDVV